MGKDYRRLKAWELCDAFAFAVYEATRAFPSEEAYALTSQLRRAALSAPTNIVEGANRQTQRDYVHFLSMAKASLEEAGYLIDFAQRLSYLAGEDAGQLLHQHDEAARVLHGLIARIRKDLSERKRP